MARSPAVLPPPLSGTVLTLDDPRTGRLATYHAGPASGRPLLLVHSVNAAASAYEVKPLFDHYAASRPTYAFDLPGFGLSDRRDRVYTPRLMTDAVKVVTNEIRARHPGEPIDALAVSLGCEFLARAASEDPAPYRTLSLVSPTGLDGRGRPDGPPGATRAVPGLHRFFSAWGTTAFGLLTRPGIVRYFLEKTWGAKDIDEGLWAYDVLTTQQSGAKNAPLYFVSGHLFSADARALYASLQPPVWVAHGVRGDFTDYRGVPAMAEAKGWRVRAFETGALCHFEVPAAFIAAFDGFLAAADQR